jgi:putative pyridoxal-dependent aspartate 1-decarboxylase
MNPKMEREIVAREEEMILELQHPESAVEPIPIGRVDRAARIPLSLVQEELVSLEAKDGTKSVWDFPTALRVKGVIDIRALEAAFGAIIRRHESLRTLIIHQDGQFWQKVQEEVPLKLQMEDLSGLNITEAESEAYRRIEEDRGVRFELQNDLPIRIRLFRVKSDEFILFVNTHRTSSDLRSLKILEREIVELYDSFKKKERPALQPIPVQYADFAAWQRRLVKGSVLERQRTYWAGKLKGFQALELRMDWLRPAEAKFNNDVISIEIREQAVQGLKLLSGAEGFCMGEIVLAAIGVLVHRYTGQDDICIGWEIDKRSKLELSSLIGCFANTLPLRVDFSGNPTFIELVRRFRDVIAEARTHSDVPLEEIARVAGLQGARYGLSPIRVMVAFDSTQWSKISKNDLDISVIDTLPRSPGFDLTIDVNEGEDGIRGRIEYNADIFRREKIERMMLHFSKLVDDIVQNPVRQVGRLELLDAKEKEQILGTWNETRVEYPKSVGVHTLFEEQAEKTPDKVALIYGDEELTYRDLNEKANQLAHYLRKRGVSAGSLVAINVDHSFDLVIGILGIIKAGGIYVPSDPSYPSDRLGMIVKDCKAPFLLTKVGSAKCLSDFGLAVIHIDRDWKDVGLEPVANPENLQSEDSLFYVMYTSGSTGRPKGVAGTYQGIINRLFWMWETFPFSEDEVCCMKTSAGFVDHVAEIFGPLLKGIPLVIFSREEVLDTEKMLDLIIERKITRVVLVPSQLQKMLAARKEKVFQLTGLRYVFCSGEALPVRLAKQFYQDIRNAKLINIYGTTEVSADVAYYEVKRFHVDDVLKYFTRSLELPDSVIDVTAQRYPTPVATERITEPNVPIEEIARRFTSSRITEWPITLEQYYQRLHKDVLPYVINTAAPTFIGHMTSALPDFVHDLSKLVSQLNQNLVKIETGKSLIFLEREALAILHRCFYEFSDMFYESHVQQVNMNLGLITTGGTSANIIGLLTARNRALFGGERSSSGRSIHALLREKGYEEMTILGSKLMHYSMRKATSVLGLGMESIMYVDCDGDGRLDMRDLLSKVDECRRRKILILAIVGIAGATETGQIEPLADMGDLANSLGIHFHVDAAWGGATILSETHKCKLAGIQKADSITFCGHKQLYLPQGISVCLFKDPRQAQYAAVSATYQASPNTFDVGRFTLEGSRSAISLCLHAALRVIGKRGYELLVDRGIEMGRFFADLVKSIDGFELIGYPELNIVNYRYIPIPFRGKFVRGTLTEEDNRKINRINATIQETQFNRGKTFVSKTNLFQTRYGKGNEIVVFRVVLSNPLTTQADIYGVLEDQLMIVKELFGEANEISFGEKGTAGDKGWEGGVKSKPVFVDEHQEAFVPIGKPLANSMLYILDKYGNPTPIGIPGELYVGGVAVNRGYFNMSDLTEKVFVPNPFTCDPQGRLFKTGDRARFLEDGNIEYLGRYDDQVKIQGYRVEIAEVELALREIEHVENCAVMAKTDAEGNRCLVAYLVLKGGGIDISVIRNALAAKLPSHMVPSVFRLIQAMPLTPSGKTNKKALVEFESADCFSSEAS